MLGFGLPEIARRPDLGHHLARPQTRGIDIGAKKLVLETLVRLNRELGMTVVIISSELQELKSVSDRIAIVSEGKLVDILSPQASDADYGLAMSGIRPSEHLEKEGTNA